MADLDYAAQLEAAYQQQQVSRAASAQRQAEEAQRQQADAAAAAAEAERTRGRTWGELAGDVGAGALQSAVGLGGAAYGLANVGTLGFLDRATGFSQNLSQTQDILESYKSAPLQAKKAEMQQTFKQDGVGSGLAYTLQNPSIIADLATQSAAYLIPGAAAARAAGGLAAAGAAGRGLSQAAGSQLAQKAATKASLLSQAALSGGYMNVDGVNAARKAGMSENEVQLTGLAAGAAGALLNTAITKVTGAGSLEAMAAQRFGGAAMPTVAGSAARQIAGGTVKEATEEALQEGSENAIRNVAAGRPAGEGAGMSMALGGLLGGALGGVMGAANVRRPSQTRDQIAQQQREVERELAGAGLGSFTPSTLVESPLSALTGGRDQAQYDFAGNQLDLAGTPLGEQGATLNYGQPADMQPTAQQQDVAPGQGALFDEAGQPTREEINLDEAGLPLAGQLPQVEELTGARAVIAARKARLAGQPPRMGVAELAADEVAIDTLPRPAVETQSLREVMRTNAPIGKVLELFGPEAAGVEAARRAQVSTVPGEVATERAPIDLTTDVAAKKYKAQLNQAFRAAGVDIRSSAANRAELDEIAAQVASAGVRPTDADFAQVVGAAAERVASSRGAENAGVSALIAGKYPIDPETQAAIRAGAEFDRMVAEPAPAQPTKEEAIAEAVDTGLVPASAVTKLQTGQVWVDTTGAEHTVVGVIDGKPLVRGPDGRKKPMYLSAMRKNNWSVKAQPVVEGLDAQAVGDLRTLLASTYWQERGGKLLRAQGLEGDVVGRTEWLSSVPEVQAVLSGTGYDAADVSALLDRAATGQGKALTAKQVSLVEGVLAAMQDMRQQQTTDTPATAPDTSLPSPARPLPAEYELRSGERFSSNPTTKERMRNQWAVFDRTGNMVSAGWSQSREQALSAFNAYEQMPAAPVIDAITAGRADVASLNPTFDGMIGALDAAQTVADASAAAFAARQHPTYIQMSPEDTLAFEHHLAEVMASLNGIKLDLGPVVNGAGKPAVSDVIFRGLTAAASRQTGIPTVAHVDVANAEYVVGYAIPANARGFYDPATGTIHIIQSNNTDKAELAFTLAHEAGHAGLDKLLGANLQSATNRMWANAPMRERIKAHIASSSNPDMTRSLAAEEVLADMLAAGEKINTDVMTKLRNGVRNFFARLVGIRDLVVTNEEVDRLLADVALVINGEQPVNVKIGGQDAALWLNNPSSIAAQNPKFSLAKADYEAMVAAAKNEPASNVLPLSHIAKALGQASVDSAKQAGNALTENKLGRAYVRNFMHLDHLVSWYDKKFNPTGAKTGGFLRKVADLKQGREAQFNRLNAKRKDLTYKTVVNGNEVVRKVGNVSVNDATEVWDKFKRFNPDKARALDFALTEGTFYQVFPDRSWEDQVHKDFDYEGKGYTEAERMAAYERASNAYKAAGTQGQLLYMQSQAVYAQRFNEHYAAIKQEAERLGARAKADAEKNGVDVELVTARVDNATARYKDAIGRVIGKVQQGPYSPLQRYGEYVMTVRDKDGAVVHFSAYDTKRDADAAAADILEARIAAGEKVNVNVSAAKDAEFDSTGVARGEIESIRNEVMGMLPAGMDTKIREQAMAAITAGLTEAYLQSLPAKSFAKHALGRKNVAGYDTDALRAFANYTMRSARAVAGVEYDGRIANSLMDVQTFVDDTAKGKYTDKMGVVDTAQLQNIADSVKRQHKESLRSDSNKIVDTLTSASFIYMMTSISHLLFNATQTVMVTFPRLAGLYGAGKASKHINKAMGEYFRSGFDMLTEKSVLAKSGNPADKLLHEVLTTIRENGPLDITQSHDIAGIADGSSSDLSPYWGKVMKWASYAMHKSEVFNRQVAATAAVRMELEKVLAGGIPPTDPAARDALVADLVRVGEEAIRSTQYDYSKMNKPPILQGPMGKVIGQYQQYRLHMLAMIGKDIRDAELGNLFGEPINKEEAAIARSTLAWTLGMQLALTGTTGTILAPFVFALADMWRDDDDLTTSAQAWSNMVGSFASHGVFAGLLDTSRIAASTLIPIIGQSAYAPVGEKAEDTFTYYVTQNLGPSFGLTRNLYAGTVALMNGDMEKARDKLLPKPLADGFKAYYEGADGARDARQITYFEPGPFDTLLTATGFKSGERRDIEARRGALYTANANRFAIKERNLNRLAQAYSRGDAAAIAEAERDINAWNDKYPDMAIQGSERRSAVVSRIRTERTAADTGFSSTRAPAQSLVEKIGQ